MNLPQTVDFAQGDSDATPGTAGNARAKGGCDSDSAGEPYNGLANRRLQPLGHSSACGSAYSFEVSASNGARESGESGESEHQPGGHKGGHGGHNRHPLELARLSRRAILRVGDFEPLPAIGQRRRRRFSGHKSGHSKIVLFLALFFLLAACSQERTCNRGDKGVYIGDAILIAGCPREPQSQRPAATMTDASGNLLVPR